VICERREQFDRARLQRRDRLVGRGIARVRGEEAFRGVSGGRMRLGAHRGEHPVERLRLGLLHSENRRRGGSYPFRSVVFAVCLRGLPIGGR
jgi:hypothetical protein